MAMHQNRIRHHQPDASDARGTQIDHARSFFSFVYYDCCFVVLLIVVVCIVIMMWVPFPVSVGAVSGTQRNKRTTTNDDTNRAHPGASTVAHAPDECRVYGVVVVTLRLIVVSSLFLFSPFSFSSFPIPAAAPQRNAHETTNNDTEREEKRGKGEEKRKKGKREKRRKHPPNTTAQRGGGPAGTRVSQVTTRHHARWCACWWCARRSSLAVESG